MLRGGADVICPPRDGVCKKWVVVEQRRGLGLLMSRHVRRGRLYQGEGAFPVLLRISEEAQAGLCDVVVSGGGGGRGGGAAGRGGRGGAGRGGGRRRPRGRGRGGGGAD